MALLPGNEVSKSDSKLSSYLEFLPAIYRRQDSEADHFLGLFLLAFESIFSSGYQLNAVGQAVSSSEDDEPGKPVPGLEQYLDFLHLYFHSQRAPHTPEKPETDFLPWLFTWIGLEWYDDLSERELRRLLQVAVRELYPFRGTKTGLTRYLEVAANASLVKLIENRWPANMQIGLSSTIGRDTLLSDNRTVERLHCFMVKVRLRWQPLWYKRIMRGEKPGEEFGFFEAASTKVRKILLQECPAHTKFRMYVTIGTMEIGCAATIGMDSFLA